jgi:hypothetical protein
LPHGRPSACGFGARRSASACPELNTQQEQQQPQHSPPNDSLRPHARLLANN